MNARVHFLQSVRLQGNIGYDVDDKDHDKSPRQQHTQTHSICKQDSVKCRKKIQQHWKRCTRYTKWAQEVPSLLLWREVSIITDQKPSVAIFMKDVSMLYQIIQQIFLRIQQYRVRIIYKPVPDLFIADWLSRQNHKERKDEEVPDMQLNIYTIQTTINIAGCLKIQQLQQATSQDNHLLQLKDYIIQGWPENKDQITKTWEHTRHFEMIWQWLMGAILKGRCAIIPESLEKQALEQLHVNHTWIKKLNSWWVNQFIGQISMIKLKST